METKTLRALPAGRGTGITPHGGDVGQDALDGRALIGLNGGAGLLAYCGLQRKCSLWLAFVFFLHSAGLLTDSFF